MRCKLECTQVDTFIVTEFPAGHVPMILHDLAHNLRCQFFFLAALRARLLFAGPLPLAEVGPLLRLHHTASQSDIILLNFSTLLTQKTVLGDSFMFYRMAA